MHYKKHTPGSFVFTCSGKVCIYKAATVKLTCS